MSMPIRSHFGRPFDIRLPSNLAMVAVVLISGGVALVRWLNGSPLEIFLAPVYAFLIWALLREVDPDHNWTALAGGVGAGAWVLLEFPVVSVFAVAGLMLAARLVTETTGRRPLPIDLAVAAGTGVAIGFTIEGWVAGFGLAIALYMDNRMSDRVRGMQIAAAAITAIGTTVVATAARVFPETIPDVLPQVAVPAGLIALALVGREAAHPITEVDARHKSFMRGDRLDASRSLIGVLAFGTVLLLGDGAEGMVPVLGALLLAILSNEVERIRRPM